MKFGRYFVIALAVSFIAGPAHSFGGSSPTELVLVDSGVSVAPIVVYAGAPPKTRRAADELAGYIELISSARPEVIEGRPEPLPTRAIWVGWQPILDELFPGLDFNFAMPEEILIAANGEHLVIAGRDRWHEDFLTREGRNWSVIGIQEEYGTVNAVYTFLQDFLDVRWLMPGDVGIDVIERDTIALPEFEYRYWPQFRQRSTLFRLSEPGDNRGISADWARFQRLQLDSLDMTTGGHLKDDWWKRFHETNPEYFALQPDGTRSGFPGPTLVKRCKSNPGVWRQWAQDVADALEVNPTQQVFMAGINDSHNRGVCICPDCLAWDNPNASRILLSWEGLSQRYVSLSDRYAKFYNSLARELRQRYPDRDDLYVRGGAYGSSVHPPVDTVVDDNVINPIVAYFWMAEPQGREQHMAYFSGWAEKASNLVWRPNAGPRFGWAQGLPNVGFRETMEDFRFVADHGCIGLAFDTIWEIWAVRAPLYYLMGQLAWNPYADGEAILNDFYVRTYGPASDQMRQYWEALEELTMEHRGANIVWEQAYLIFSPERLASIGQHLVAARGQLDGEPQVYRDRLRLAEAGFEYVSLMMVCAKLVEQVRSQCDTMNEAAAAIRENWKQLEAIHEQFPLGFRFHEPYRMQVIHPDTYLKND